MARRSKRDAAREVFERLGAAPDLALLDAVAGTAADAVAAAAPAA